MGNQSSSEKQMDSAGEYVGRDRQKKKKKSSLLNCQCGKGRDDKDEIDVGGARAGTKLTEEEWAKVKTGRLHIDRGQPDLVLEESEHPKPRSRPNKDSEVASDARARASRRAEQRNGNGVSTAKHEEPSNPYKKSTSTTHQKLPERFKIGDRVKCACKKWGNLYEIGSVIKIGYREDNWPADKPDAPYQVKLDKGALIYAPEDSDEYIMHHDESWAKELPPGSPWYLQPGALDRELAKIGAYR